MRKLSAALFLFLAATATRGDWVEKDSQNELSTATGLEHRHLVLENSETGDRATIELAIFSTKSFTLRVVDQLAESRGTLAQAMRREKYLAGVNGGYFAADYAPIGLLIVDGKMIAPLQRARLLTGVLTASAHGVQIVRIREFSKKQNLSAAVECGPMIVDLGQRVRGLEATREARRTFAAADRADRAALGFCSEVTLADLSRILTTPSAGDFRIYRALNLDGGSSSAFWFKRQDGSVFSIDEEKTVRDFMAIVPK